MPDTVRYAQRSVMGIPLESPARPPLIAVEALLARLPASTRAALTWTQPVLRSAFQRLLTEPLTGGLVAAVTEIVWMPYRQIFAVVLKTFAGTPGVYAEVVEASLTEMESSISGALKDEDAARDLLRLAVSWLRNWFRMSVPHLMTMAAAEPAGLEIPAEDVARMSGAPEGALLRALVLLAAAAEGSRETGDHHRLLDLLDVAFLELSAGIDVMQAVVSALPSVPFPAETPPQRQARLLCYVEVLRRQARRTADRAAAEAEAQALAKEGVAEWFESLPQENWKDAIDEGAFRPVKWVDGVGFVEEEVSR